MDVSSLSPAGWIALTGGLGAACTTLAFVPQIVRTWRRGGRDLAYGMLFLYLLGLLLWLAYGFLTQARAVILANAAAGALVLVAIAVKGWREKHPPRVRRARVAIDMDEVVADFATRHLHLYNQTFGERLTLDDLDGRGLAHTVPAERAHATEALITTPGFFRDLPVVPESQQVIRDLAERYEVFIASAAMDIPFSFDDKYAWLREHFPFIPPSHVVFCGDKAVLDADYLIDDSPRHFARFRGTPLLFSAPHNQAETRYQRVSGWGDVRRLLLEDDAVE